MSQATAVATTSFTGSRPVTPAMVAKDIEPMNQLESMREIEEIPAISLEDATDHEPTS